MEKTDVAFYAVLAKGLATTGTEMNTFTSGFSDLPGVTAQTWYHWGELWLASAMISIFGVAPLAARYLVVLPLLLLAAGALTGTLVRRINGSVSRPAFVFGFAICLILTPVPLLTGPFFSVWAAGLLYGIAVFGLAAVAVLFALYLLAVMGSTETVVAARLLCRERIRVHPAGAYRDRPAGDRRGRRPCGRSGSCGRSSRRVGCQPSRRSGGGRRS